MHQMRLAAYQMVATPGDVPRNLAAIIDAAERAKAAGAGLLVAPELATTGYGLGDDLLRLAEAKDGAQAEQLSTAAGRIGIAIVAGFAERAGNRVYNAALLVTPEGGRHVYRKCQLYGDYEKRLFKPGPVAPAVFDVGGVNLGMLICFDVEFPELVRCLSLAGAGIIAVPTALPDDPVFQMIPDRMISVRAFENQIPIVYVNHAGADPAFSFAGRSVICLPDGSEAARAPRTGEALIFADYEPANFAASREANCYLRELRTDL
jgi:predicted amidohydrolase